MGNSNNRKLCVAGGYALHDLIEEITWLLDPESEDIVSFLEEIFVLSEKGLGKTLIRLGFAKNNEDTGLVAEVDNRFTLRITAETFKWRAKAVRAARVGSNHQISSREPIQKIRNFFAFLLLDQNHSFDKESFSYDN